MGYYVVTEYRDNGSTNFFTYDYDDVLVAVGAASNNIRVTVTTLEVKSCEVY
jgi:hypothetical protein